MSSYPRVTLYSRVGCHLCDEARSTIEAVIAETGDTYVEVDIDADPDLQKRYTEEVPVVLIDGKQHTFWRVDPARFASALRTS